MSEESRQDIDLPAPLVERLRRIEDASAIDTAEVDFKLSALAAQHFAGRSKPAMARYGSYVAVAASIAMVSALFSLQYLDWWSGQEAGDFATLGPARAVSVLYADVDDSGRIDIADVLALARDKQAGISQTELDAFAFRVVSLSGEVGVGR